MIFRQSGRGAERESERFAFGSALQHKTEKVFLGVIGGDGGVRAGLFAVLGACPQQYHVRGKGQIDAGLKLFYCEI